MLSNLGISFRRRQNEHVVCYRVFDSLALLMVETSQIRLIDVNEAIKW